MKTQDSLKRNYTAPELELIRLDHEISLALESSPPIGPGEMLLMVPDLLSNDPFNM